ncbi:MAG: septum formation initiator family protein [Pyrinomonadaceae bacterium]
MAETKTSRSAPWWLSMMFLSTVFVMLCVSVNFRAYSEMNEEAGKNTRLASQIESLMDENLVLQEEIHTLKTDPQVIRREARRLGVYLQTEKVPMPTNLTIAE